MTFVEKFTEIKIRLDTAAGMLNWFKNLILMTAGVKFIISLSQTATIVLGLLLILVMYFIGWLSLDIIKLPQVEAKLRDGKYNPFLMNLDKKVSGAYTKSLNKTSAS